jgi:hypothetical protein
VDCGGAGALKPSYRPLFTESHQNPTESHLVGPDFAGLAHFCAAGKKIKPRFKNIERRSQYKDYEQHLNPKQVKERIAGP